jgi:polyhydroxyalkanoate synthesis regulator phasin
MVFIFQAKITHLEQELDVARSNIEHLEEERDALRERLKVLRYRLL